MKIKQLDVKGFRSLKDVSWQPGDLNVVIGQNGTGKSNLLRMLELISASAQGKLSKYIQSAGGMGAILWDGVARAISFRLRTVSNQSWPYTEDDYEVELAGSSGLYYIQREKWSCSQVDPKDLDEYVETIDRNRSRIIYKGQQVDSAEAISEQETLLSLLNQFTVGMWKRPTGKDFREELSEICVYHDMNVGQNSEIRQASVTRFEKRVESDGQNLVSVLHTLYTGDREFKRNVDSAMHAAFGSDYEEIVFPPAADQRVQLRVRWKNLNREQSAADLSDGTLRFLLLLTALVTPEPPMLVAIVEPETGLHPAMLPIIAEFAVEAASRTQIVFTTHSPQFLDAFTGAKPTTTVAKWENGETTLHTLEGEDLAYWLEDYSLGRLFQSGQLEAMT